MKIIINKKHDPQHILRLSPNHCNQQNMHKSTQGGWGWMMVMMMMIAMKILMQKTEISVIELLSAEVQDQMPRPQAG